MRVDSLATLTRSGVRLGGLAAHAALLAACSSQPLDSASSDGSAGSPSSAGSGNVSPGGSASVAGPDYQKQDYPAGPYGNGVGSTLENFGFLGWRDPVASNYDQNALEEVRLGDFYDPDGSKNIKLIWINASAVWCTVCRAEMMDIRDNEVNATFKPRGVQLIVTLFEDNKSGPAKPLDLHNWGNQDQYAIDFPLLLDPGFKLGAFFTSDATPLNMLVDARTMRVLNATMGYSLDYWQQVDRLLKKYEE
jgi:hypothetical protein